MVITRLVIIVAIFIVAIVGFWSYFRIKHMSDRRVQVGALESMGFSVRQEGIIDNPESHRDITSASGHLQGYDLELRVAALIPNAGASRTQILDPCTTVSTNLRHRLSDARITRRRWGTGDRMICPPGPEDGRAVLLDVSSFDEGYFLYCRDADLVRQWLTSDGAQRFASLGAPKEFVQVPYKDGNGIRVRGNELSLRVTGKSAEQLDVQGLMSFVATVARLFDELGVRAAER